MKIKKKIIKNIFIQKILSFLAALFIYFVKKSSKINYINKSIPQKFWQTERPFILAFWHSQLMMIPFSWEGKKRLNILASNHSDGRFGAYTGKFFKLNNILSDPKNNKISLRLIYENLNKKNYIGITPDGPRGPKNEASEGIIRIAKKTQVPIIPCGFWSSKNLSLNSWDNFLITLPFSNCCFVWGNPLIINKDLNKKEIKIFQNELKNKIENCINIAKKNI